MKAIVYEKYGPPDVLELKDIPQPVARDDEVLIAMRATTVSSGDVRMRALNVPYGFGLLSRLALGVFAPRTKILGMELSGVIVAIGKNVTRFKVGTPVFGMSETFGGCYAEYRSFPEKGPLVEKPENISFEQAAAFCFGGTTALDFLRRGNLRAGERLLINGASGAVGTAAVQLAKHFGAHVTAVCSGTNAELVRALGADAMIDYTRQDFTQNGETYDLIMDTAGTAPFSRVKESLEPGGRFLMVLGGLPETLGAAWVNLTSGRQVVAGVAKVRLEDVQVLAELAVAGQYKAVIDRSFPLDRIVEAHAYVDQGHKKGNVVITIPKAS